MLTDTVLRNLKPKFKTYQASDRNGIYATVSTVGTVTFRYDYRLNGRRETLTIGRYGRAGISLALARERLIDAKKGYRSGQVLRAGEAAREAPADCGQDLWRHAGLAGWPMPAWPTARAQCARASSTVTSFPSSRTDCSLRSVPTTCARCATR